jgi:hypothetical protein
VRELFELHTGGRIGSLCMNPLGRSLQTGSWNNQDY